MLRRNFEEMDKGKNNIHNSSIAGTGTMAYTAVSRTATDSLQAKYSAVLLAGYKVFPANSTSWKGADREARSGLVEDNGDGDGDGDGDDDDDDDDDDELSYRSLLQRMTEFSMIQQQQQHKSDTTLSPNTTVMPTKVPMVRRQTPLVNLGYAIRISNVLHHIRSFHEYYEANHPSLPTQLVVLGAGLDVTGLWYCRYHNHPAASNNNNNTNNESDPKETNCQIKNKQEQQKVRMTRRRHVVEVDVPTICQQKARAIHQLNLLNMQDDKYFANEEERMSLEQCSIVYQGFDNNESDDMTAMATYTLVAADLENATAVEEIFAKVLIRNVPTLLVSELVLAYLQPETCDHILRQSATFLSPGSCVVLYETLGSQSATLHDAGEGSSDIGTARESICSRPLSVLDSYQSCYGSKFNAKLQRGKADPGGSDAKGPENAPLPFHSLAASGPDAQQRLQTLGFRRTYAATAGVVAAAVSRKWSPTELFDEHAALALHLQSYAVVCAFPSGGNPAYFTASPHVVLRCLGNLDIHIFTSFMCGAWTTANGILRLPRLFRMHNRVVSSPAIEDTTCSWITSIERVDESQVRHVFLESYKEMCERYVSVRKMVKSALRTDLGIGHIAHKSRAHSVHDPMVDTSVIGSHYQNLGGDFVVAIQILSTSEGFFIQNDSCDPTTNSRDEYDRKAVTRRVIGGIGVRRWTKNECLSRAAILLPFVVDSSKRCYVYEIQRFFVAKHFQGRGVGTALLDAVSQRLRAVVDIQQRQQSTGNSSPVFVMVATTPAVLEEANRVYVSKNFRARSDVDNGELNMRTYTKRWEIQS